MKFLHAADLHLDSPLRGLARYDEAPVEVLRGATRREFNNLIELAIEERVDFVLLAGDLYDGTWQDFSTAIFLAKKLGELDRAGIQVFGVLGNHDAQSKLTKALERPKNLTLFPANKPHTEVLNDLGVAVHGQSFVQQHVKENLAIRFPKAIPGYSTSVCCTRVSMGARGTRSTLPASLTICGRRITSIGLSAMCMHEKRWQQTLGWFSRVAYKADMSTKLAQRDAV